MLILELVTPEKKYSSWFISYTRIHLLFPWQGPSL